MNFMSSQVTVDQFSAEFRRVRLPMGLVVDRLVLSGSGAAIEVDPFGFAIAEAAPVEAFVAALDIAGFLNEKAPGGLKDFAISIREGKLYVEATARVIVEVRAKAVCTLRVQDGRAIYIDLESVDVMGMGAKSMVQSQLDQINPILDVSDLPVAMQLKSVQADHDQIVLHGTIEGVRP